MAYFLNLYSPATYEAFSKSDRTVTGFQERHQAVARRVKSGDVLLCYVTKLDGSELKRFSMDHSLITHHCSLKTIRLSCGFISSQTSGCPSKKQFRSRKTRDGYRLLLQHNGEIQLHESHSGIDTARGTAEMLRETFIAAGWTQPANNDAQS